MLFELEINLAENFRVGEGRRVCCYMSPVALSEAAEFSSDINRCIFGSGFLGGVCRRVSALTCVTGVLRPWFSTASAQGWELLVLPPHRRSGRWK